MGTIAVVGGTGFLGRHVVSALRQAGNEPRVLSRRTGTDALRLDAPALSGCEAVVNLAGIKREQGAQTFKAVHVDLVRRLVEVMKETGIRRLIHISVLVARAEAALPYHDTKWKGEEIVRQSGLEWTILRPGVVYGVGDDLLSHLSLMIETSPIFPIAGDGRAAMMPVHAGDVAAAVTVALALEASVRKIYEVVGPERLELRDVVKRVAAAMGRPAWIWPTPVVLMKPPVQVMEACMKQPLSTRAQLAMLVEGMAGDPGPAREELGVSPAPFTPERIRGILDAGGRTLKKEIPAAAAIGLYSLAALLLAFAFRGPLGPWKGMTVVMGVLLAGSLGLKAVRSRLRPSVGRLVGGAAAGGLLYLLTRLGVLILDRAWPSWIGYASELNHWKEGHSIYFIVTTLVMIIVAEEALWRGVLARFAVERLGRIAGVVAAAALYAAAHVSTGNPLLVAAAFGCGLLWGLLYSATDDLTAPIASHLVWDVMFLFVAPVV